MEVLTVTKSEIIKDFLKKCVLPMVVAALLYFMFKNRLLKDGKLDLLLLWILCGLPFGLHRMRIWILAGTGSPERRYCTVRDELRHRRAHRRLCSGVASAGGCMVYSLDHLSPLGLFPKRHWER